MPADARMRMLAYMRGAKWGGQEWVVVCLARRPTASVGSLLTLLPSVLESATCNVPWPR